LIPYIICLTSFAISFLAIPPLISLANNKGVIALPGRRHIHAYPTPKFGGIAIALSVLFIAPFVLSQDRMIGSYLLSSAIILMLGIIDDIKGSSWTIKLGFSLAATSVLIFGGDVYVRSLGDLFGRGEIQLGIWGIPFTYIAVFGVTNAINLIDGLDGLACGMSSIAFLSFAIFASVNGNDTVFYLSVANLGATLGLFRYNYPRAKIFMGDSGSLFLGFSLSVTAILLTQGGGTMKPMVPVLVLGIPIFDTVRVMTFRVLNKRHPFVGDRTHLHHLMVRSGITKKRVVKSIWLLSALMSSLAFVLYRLDTWVMLLVFCIFVISMGVFIENLRIIKGSASRR
jgi:UDP-GlcNAc:undecaprenyl-phosphate GlcNAc-1-phosphate transferase